jgi:hypothetical protein
MPPRERPPVTDAEFKVVRGPWPRWAYRLGLMSLALWTGAIVAVCIVIGLVVVALWPET